MRKSRQTENYKRKRPHFSYTTAAILFAVCILLMVLSENTENKIYFSSARKNNLIPQNQKIISVYHNGEILQIGLEDYLVGVTAAEMPADYHPEALKAQAVAARTYTLRKLSGSGCSRHDADICTDSGHCQAYADEARLKKRWGEDFAKNSEKIKQAVYDTAGEIAAYRGEAIDAMYHASSGGATENSENVYKNRIEYLRGVESPDTEGYEKTVSYARTEFAEKINHELGTDITADELTEKLAVDSRSESGRVKSVRIKDKVFSGTKFRGAADLPSAMFTYTLTEEDIVFSVKGYGHGVGMSQSGANYYAGQGLDYRDILQHYYTDIEIVTIDAE